MPADSAVARTAEHLAHEVLTRYLALCDVPRPPDVTGRLDDLFTPDAVWEGLGPLYTEKFGRTTGRAAIAAMLSAHLPPNGHFRSNVHLLHPGTTSADGEEVRGRWLMQQLSRFDSGAAELVVARLDVTFRIDGRHARICRFGTERVFDADLGPALADRVQEVSSR
ncbi:nuclear transport factor 2 family protein [Rhodococcus opacus]|nr:nuclear transport factor 2 family protein [Rhodococcus opacus]RZL85227.1 MAG: nuclear transport factor 2 family protein [Rhodococcus sp. (in: high G+C Gram-positive bacteria)]